MKYLTVFHPLLRQDLGDAAEWYDQQSPGLGEQFIAAFEDAVATVSKYPLASAIFFDHFRQVKVDRFSWLLIYEVRANVIFFQKLVHASRHPHKKLRN